MIRSILLVGICAPFALAAAETRSETLAAPPRSWQRQPTDLRVAPDTRIRAFYHPADQPVATRSTARTPGKIRRQTITTPAVQRRHQALAAPVSSATALIIDSPPIDGFVPWIAVVATDERSAELELDAVPSTTVGGSTIRPQPLENDYAVGLYDTGASIHVMGRGAATTLGLIAAGKLTSSDVLITGVTGSVTAKVSKPIGLYIDGLDAIDPSTLLLDTTAMVGQYNVSIAVGQTPPPGQPDLPTVPGSPMAVYYAAVFDNDQPVTRTVNSVDYQAPRIRFFQANDSQVPEYSNYVPLELRPLGASSVQYIPCLDLFGGCPDGFGAPSTPSIVIGIGSQSLFFVGSVDLYNGAKSAIDKDRFIIDTGAQVTVVGSRVGARLGLNPATPHFLVEIQGVDGQSVFKPGFYITSIQIPALGEWLTFNRVPVVLLDVASPEGGTLDGIIGMNLLLNFNFVLRGGGMFNQPDPSLEYEVLVPPVTDCDFDDDGDVDMEDFGVFQRCLSGPDTVQNEPACAGAKLDADSDVDAGDMAIFSGCLSGPNVPAAGGCIP
ncbi:MAG TPA: retropepsin-like aspartic protease [Phycisphaerae bacterium]|nr:retropepsin-like aspartic protease [Phycisphaerae bacterium]